MTTDYATQSTQDPEQLRREIARTRADMDRTLAELEDRVSPSRIRERQTEKVRGRLHRARSAVMGATPDTHDMRDRASGMADSAGGHLSEAGDAIQQTPQMVEDATRGNPLAAGVIAMGIGALLGSLIPPSKAEEQFAGQLRDNFEEPVKQQLQQAGEEMKGELQEHAQEAVEETKQSAQQAMDTTRNQAHDAAGQVQDQAETSAQHLRDRR